MNRKKLLGLIILLLATFCLTVTSHAGPKWEFGENAWMKLDLLAQVHFSYLDEAEDAALAHRAGVHLVHLALAGKHDLVNVCLRAHRTSESAPAGPAAAGDGSPNNRTNPWRGGKSPPAAPVVAIGRIHYF